jgi:hypothetical protein
LALRTYSSGEYRIVGGQFKRSKKVLAVRGLNINHNHDLKNIFKGAATRAASTAGPFQDFYHVSTTQLVLLQNPKAPSQQQNGSTKSEHPRVSQQDIGWRARRTFLLLPVAGDVDSPL